MGRADSCKLTAHLQMWLKFGRQEEICKWEELAAVTNCSPVNVAEVWQTGGNL